jgi:hypothetical protein
LAVSIPSISPWPFFIIRAKSNFDFQRLYSQPVDKTTGVQADQIITPQGFYAQKDYPENLRRIRYLDGQNNKRFVFLTNNFLLPALTIAELYRCRWQSELFFNESNSIFALRPSMELRRMRSKRKFGLLFRFMRWSPSSKNVWESTIVSTQFYRF